MIKFTTQLNKKEVGKAAVIATFQITAFKIITILYLISIAWSSLMAVIRIGPSNIPISLIIFGVIYFIIIYFIILWKAKSDKRIFEKVDWFFNNDYLQRIGQTFEMKVMLNSIYKVVENKNWFFVWINKTSYYIIPKKDLYDDNITALKNVFKNYPQIIKYYKV